LLNLLDLHLTGFFTEILASGRTPGRRFGGHSRPSTQRGEGLGAADVPWSLGHIETLLTVLTGLLVVQGSVGLLVLLHPLFVSNVLDVLLLQDLQMIDAILDVVVIPRDDNETGVVISTAGETDVDLEIIHDLPDAPSPLADDHGVDPGVDVNLLVDLALELTNYLQDSVPGLVDVLFITSNGDDVGVLGLFLGKLNLNIMNVSQIGDDGSTSTDNFGMIVRIDIDLDLVSLQGLVGFFLPCFPEL